ncbi:MAG: O-antigen ligase family protein [Solirubrobacteraceae bacterium]
MSTARLHGLGRGEPTGARHPDLSARSHPAGVLAVALLAVCGYAAFAHGAVGPTATERLQLVIAIVAAGAVAAWLWSGTFAVNAPALVWGGLGLLAAFAAWSGLTLLWSVSPDQTWAECNRALTYALVVGLAITLGASHRHAVELVAGGFLAVCLAVTAYGLGQKLFPGVHVGGLLTLDQTGQLPRLQEPFGYWNALALFVAFGVPIALSLAVDGELSERVRVPAAAAIVPMLVTIAFTYSRGAVLALVCGLAVGIALGGARLRSLLWLALACLAALPPAILGLMSHPLTGTGVDLGARELAGAELTAVLAACVLLLSIAARRLVARERRTSLSALDAQRIGRALARLLAVLVVVAVLAVAFSARGLGGTVSHAWHSFTATKATSVYDPGRLLSADSENRWVWWKEAARAFGDRPVAGWGAGSFGVVHLLFRRDTLTVQQPHSVPLQFLTETGVVGAILGLGAFALLTAGGLGAVRQRPSGRARLLAAALLAGSVMYAVHALYDWDWDIPGVTLPALLFLGVLGGSARHEQPPTAVRRSGWRAAGLAAAALCLAAFAFSVVVPRLAAADAQQALVSASGASRPALQGALASALDASRLNPLSDAGLLAAATIELHLGHDEQSRRYVLAAVGRQPTDGQAWQQLAFEDLVLRDNRDALIAARQALALDPHGAGAIALARRVGLLYLRR